MHPARRVLLAALALLALTVSGCAVPHSLDASAPAGVPSPTATQQIGSPGKDDLVVRYGGTELRLESLPDDAYYTAAPDGSPFVAADELYVFVRPAGWWFSAEQRGEDVGCGPHAYEPVVTDLGGGWHKVTRVGPAGDYDLWLSGASGPGLPIGGTVGASHSFLKWQTQTSTELEKIAALDVTRGIDGDGSVSLWLYELGATPESVEATVTLRGPSGETITVRPTTPDWACDQPGDLTLAAPLTGDQETAIGEEGIDYTVDLVLDGVTYTASGEARTSQSNDLAFTPALP